MSGTPTVVQNTDGDKVMGVQHEDLSTTDQVRARGRDRALGRILMIFNCLKHYTLQAEVSLVPLDATIDEQV